MLALDTVSVNPVGLPPPPPPPLKLTVPGTLLKGTFWSEAFTTSIAVGVLLNATCEEPLLANAVKHNVNKVSPSTSVTPEACGSVQVMVNTPAAVVPAPPEMGKPKLPPEVSPGSPKLEIEVN